MWKIPKKEEIDYLKKIRKKVKQYVLSGGLFLTIVIAIIVLFGIPVTASSKNIELSVYEENGRFIIEGKWKGASWSKPKCFPDWSSKLYVNEKETEYEDVYTVKKTLINGAVFEDLFQRTDTEHIFYLSCPIEDEKESCRVRIVFSDKTVVFENGKLLNSK